MDDNETPEVDHTRRRLLVRLGMATVAAYAAPLLTRLSEASASSVSFSASGPRRRRRQPTRQQPQQRRAARRPQPEIVVTAPAAADIDRILAQGYTLLARTRLALIDAELARLRVPAGLTIAQARAQVLQLVPAASFDLNHIYRPGSMPCDGGDCAAFEMIGWNGTGRPCPAGTTVGMIDTGVDTRHAALKSVDIDAFPVLADGRRAGSTAHGTAVAALIAGDRGSRTPGLLDGVRVVAAAAFHRDSRGQDAADAYDIARAVDAVIARDARVVNLSLAGPPNAVLEQVVAAAAARDVILVAAAGNAGPRADPLYPAAYEGVVAVTAVDRSRRAYRQANQGPHIDFAAPGVRVWTAAGGRGGGRFRSGTSYAAPFVAAALAAARARAPRRRAADLVADLASSAVDLGPPGRDPAYGWGLVQSAGECARGDAARSFFFPLKSGG